MRNPYVNQDAGKTMKRAKFLSTLLPMLPYILMGVTVLIIIAITAFNVNADKLMNLYSSLSVDKSVNSIDKRYSFVAAYTYATGDIGFAMAAGYTEEEAEVMKTLGGQEIADMDQDGEGSVDPYSGDDVLEMSKTIASSLVNENGEIHYSQKGYGVEFDVNGYVGKSRRDCSGYVSAMLWVMGIINSNAQYGSSTFSNWGTCVATTVDKSNNTFKDVEVGDVLWRSGHVEIIVKIEDDTIYVGNAGGDSQIQQTATEGYQKTYGINDPLSAWYDEGVVQLRRG